jgi:hypothetical protein
MARWSNYDPLLQPGKPQEVTTLPPRDHEILPRTGRGRRKQADEPLVPRDADEILAERLRNHRAQWALTVSIEGEAVRTRIRPPLRGALTAVNAIVWGVICNGEMWRGTGGRLSGGANAWREAFAKQSKEAHSRPINPFEDRDGEDLVAVPWGAVVWLAGFSFWLTSQGTGRIIDPHSIAQYVGIRGSGRGKTSYFSSPLTSNSGPDWKQDSLLGALEVIHSIGCEVITGRQMSGPSIAGLLPEDSQWIKAANRIDENNHGEIDPFDGRDPNAMIPVNWWIIVQFKDFWDWMLYEKYREGKIAPAAFAQRIGVRGSGHGTAPDLKSSQSTRHSADRMQMAVEVADILRRFPDESLKSAYDAVAKHYSERRKRVIEPWVVADAWKMHGPWAVQQMEEDQRPSEK